MGKKYKKKDKRFFNLAGFAHFCQRVELNEEKNNINLFSDKYCQDDDDRSMRISDLELSSSLEVDKKYALHRFFENFKFN